MVFLQGPGGMRMVSSVATTLSPIHYAGHQGPAERFGEATHHLTHVIPVGLERIPGEWESRVTPKYSRIQKCPQNITEKRSAVDDFDAYVEMLVMNGQVVHK